MGLVPRQPGFLETLRHLCDRYGAVLIFDEVMTGFRVALGGMQERVGIKPDLTTLGKIIGGGLPVGAYGGPRQNFTNGAPPGRIVHGRPPSRKPPAQGRGHSPPDE